MESESPHTVQEFTKFHQPQPAAGKEAYVRERELALAHSPRARENYERYKRSARRSGAVDYLPIVLDIENVSRCNYRCIMCLTNDFENGKRARDMTVDEFKKLIDDQYGLIEIKLHGIGEPLLQGEKFFEMVRYARAKHIWVRTVTNASLLHLRENYKTLIDTGINEVQISIDGADKETYEKIRRNGKFEQVFSNCQKINHYCKELGISRTKMWTVVQEANIHQLEELVDVAAAMGFTNQVFSLQCYWWGSDDLANRNKKATVDYQIDSARLARLVEKGKNLGVTVCFWNIADKYSAASPETLCPWPFERAFIASEGRTVPCSMIANPDNYEIGDGEDFGVVWDSKEYTAFRQAHLDGAPPPACRSCYSSLKVVP